MKIRKQSFSDKKILYESKLSDYEKWKQSKKKENEVIKRLQRQNQKLMNQNMMLKDQNKNLAQYRQKISHHDSYKYVHLNLQTKNKQKYTSRQKLEFQYLSRQKIHVNRNLETIRSARNPIQKYDSTQIKATSTQQSFKLQRSYSQKRKKYNYGVTFQENQKYVNGKNQMKIKAFQVQADGYRYQSKEQSNINQNKAEQIQQTQSFRNNNQSAINQTETHHLKKNDELQKQVKHLKLIQSKLLDRISERDDIIEKLQRLLAQKNQNFIQSNNKSSKQPDKQTIDSTFTPRKSPH